MKRIENNKGFTIIEVVLVLAIAGLIFLMVFIALPALQAGQRDTARKADVSTVVAAVNSYASNNRGAFPDSAKLTTQVGSGISTNTTSITVSALSGDRTLDTEAGTNVDGAIKVFTKATCGDVTSGGSVALKLGTARQYAVVTVLEGGNKTGYCAQG